MDAPIIKKNDRGYFSRHAYLETEIDTSLLELKYHRRRADFHMENTIMLTPRQKWIVARMLHYAYQHTYHGLFVSRYTILWRFLQRSLVSGFYTTAPDRKKCCSVLQKSIHLATRYFHH